MAKYTFEIRELMDDPIFELFDFHYDFYTDDAPAILNFEKKFIEHYYYNEVGCETVHRFKRNLRSRLNMKMPYWKQLYETEMKAKDIEFLLNKDYRETFIKDLTSENTEKDNSTSINSGTNTVNNTSTNKGSDINNGVASVGLETGKLTSTSEVKDNGTSTNSSNITNNGNKEGTGKQQENYILEGKGNIGTTSSAELLEKWRQVLINMDEIIIDDCNDLFMLVY